MATAEQLKFDIAHLASYAGDSEYQALPTTSIAMDQLKLGTDGKFYLTYFTKEKENGVHPFDELGETVEVVILKLRRKIEKWENREMTVASHEYDSRTEKVKVAVVGGEDEELTEKEAKEKYGAKVAVIVYALKGDEIIKLKVTGQSLYNPEDIDSLRLYSYLQSFPEGKHSFMFVTKLVAKAAGANSEGQPYYNITFERGEALSIEQLNNVGDKLLHLKTLLDEADTATRKWSPIYKKKGEEEAEKQWKAVEKVEYPTESINPDDIPW